MKNLWIVNHSSLPPEYGGLNRHYYFSKYLDKAGYNVEIITSSAIHNTEINIIDQSDKSVFRTKKFGEVVYTFLKTSGYKGNGFSRIINLIQFPWRFYINYKKLKKPDLIYTSSPSPFAAFAAIIVAKKLKVPVILEIRDLWPETLTVYGGYTKRNPIIWIMYRIEKWMYKSADSIIFTFEGGVDYIRDKKWDNQIDLSKINHVNNGVDLHEYIENLSETIDDVELNDSTTFKVMYTGSIRKAYQIGNLLDAAKIIQSNYSDIRFLIWGDGNEREDLVKRCINENINNVSFKGRIKRIKIPSVLARSNVNILHLNPLGDKGLGRYGCSHNKLFDYLASGKPIVSNFKPRYDLIESNHCGIAVNSTSPDDLAEAIIKIYNIPAEEYRRICENAQKIIQNYDYQKLTQKIQEIIENIQKECRV